MGKSTIIDILDDSLVGRQEIDRTCQMITDIIAGANEPAIVINMSQVKQVSSSFIGWIVQCNKQIADRGGEFVLSNVQQSVYEVFEMTRLHKTIRIYRVGDVHELARKEAASNLQTHTMKVVIVLGVLIGGALVVYIVLRMLNVI